MRPVGGWMPLRDSVIRAVMQKGPEIALRPFRSAGGAAGYLTGGVPSALPKIASICTSASIGSAAVPTARNAGAPVK